MTFDILPVRGVALGASIASKPGAVQMSKVTLDAYEAGWRIAAGLLDADRCWRFVCMLRNIEAPGPVACCEMALALAARLKHDIREKLRKHPVKAAAG